MEKLQSIAKYLIISANEGLNTVKIRNQLTGKVTEYEIYKDFWLIVETLELADKAEWLDEVEIHLDHVLELIEEGGIEID